MRAGRKALSSAVSELQQLQGHLYPGLDTRPKAKFLPLCPLFHGGIPNFNCRLLSCQLFEPLELDLRAL